MSLEWQMRREIGERGLMRPASRKELALCVEALVRHIQRLEERLRHVSERSVWGGIYQPNVEYPAGIFITCDGTMWFSMRATSQKPGTPKSGWVMTIKTAGRHK